MKKIVFIFFSVTIVLTNCKQRSQPFNDKFVHNYNLIFINDSSFRYYKEIVELINALSKKLELNAKFKLSAIIPGGKPYEIESLTSNTKNSVIQETWGIKKDRQFINIFIHQQDKKLSNPCYNHSLNLINIDHLDLLNPAVIIHEIFHKVINDYITSGSELSTDIHIGSSTGWPEYNSKPHLKDWCLNLMNVDRKPFAFLLTEYQKDLFNTGYLDTTKTNIHTLPKDLLLDSNLYKKCLNSSICCEEKISETEFKTLKKINFPNSSYSYKNYTTDFDQVKLFQTCPIISIKKDIFKNEKFKDSYLALARIKLVAFIQDSLKKCLFNEENRYYLSLINSDNKSAILEESNNRSKEKEFIFIKLLLSQQTNYVSNNIDLVGLLKYSLINNTQTGSKFTLDYFSNEERQINGINNYTYQFSHSKDLNINSGYRYIYLKDSFTKISQNSLKNGIQVTFEKEGGSMFILYGTDSNGNNKKLDLDISQYSSINIEFESVSQVTNFNIHFIYDLSKRSTYSENIGPFNRHTTYTIDFASVGAINSTPLLNEIKMNKKIEQILIQFQKGAIEKNVFSIKKIYFK